MAGIPDLVRLVADLATYEAAVAAGKTSPDVMYLILAEKQVYFQGELWSKAPEEGGSGVSQEDFDTLYNGVVEAEEVTAAALNDLNNRLGMLAENVDTSNLATKEELNAKQDVIEDLETIRSGAAKGATALQEHQDISHLASKEELQNLQNEVIANEEVVAAALNDLNERLNNAGGGSSGGSGVVTFYIPSGETATDEEIAKNKAAYEAYVASYTNPPMVRLSYLDFPTHLYAAMSSYDIESNRIAVGIIHQADTIRQTIYAIESDGSVTML